MVCAMRLCDAPRRMGREDGEMGRWGGRVWAHLVRSSPEGRGRGRVRCGGEGGVHGVSAYVGGFEVRREALRR